MSVLKSASFLGPKSCDPLAFPVRPTPCRKICVIGMCCYLAVCSQAIACWPSMIGINYPATLTVKRAQSLCCVVLSRCMGAKVVCQFVLLLWRRLTERKIFWLLCNNMAGSVYPNLVHRLLSSILRLVTCNSPSASSIGHMIAASSFICSIMPWWYLPHAVTSNCLPFSHPISRVLTWRPQAGGGSRRGPM